MKGREGSGGKGREGGKGTEYIRIVKCVCLLLFQLKVNRICLLVITHTQNIFI